VTKSLWDSRNAVEESQQCKASPVAPCNLRRQPVSFQQSGDNGVNPAIFPNSHLLRRRVFAMRLAVPKPESALRESARIRMTCSSTNTQQREFSRFEEFSAKGSAVRRSNRSANLVEPLDLLSSFSTHQSSTL
jgi:hypothetical protein